MKKMNAKILYGWQCKVKVFGNYVIETVRSQREIEKIVKKHFCDTKNIGNYKGEAQKVFENIEKSKLAIINSKIPKKFISNTEFLSNKKIKQSKVNLLREKINQLWEEGKVNEAKQIIKNYVRFFIVKLWTYGLHENTYKFYSNFGLDKNNEVTLCDIFELTDDKNKVTKQIKIQKWNKPGKYYNRIPNKLIDYFIQEANNVWTLKNLNKYWKANIE